ncbi:MAG: hypothetical protein SFV81_16300, partial [Pirellulaceae bacterium]|nr:hypothetical protein [Pirellulaceae bacterium]
MAGLDATIGKLTSEIARLETSIRTKLDEVMKGRDEIRTAVEADRNGPAVDQRATVGVGGMFLAGFLGGPVAAAITGLGYVVNEFARMAQGQQRVDQADRLATDMTALHAD